MGKHEQTWANKGFHSMNDDNSIKLGYCSSCAQNVHHYRGRRSRLGSLAEYVLVGYWRIGYWHCCRCDKSSLLLPFRRFHRPTNNRAAEQQMEQGTEKVGNYLRSDSSLVMQSKRSSRYSQKFRDGTVRRIASGKTTIGQVCVELKVTESDIAAWFGDMLRRKDERIQELGMILDSFSRTNAHVPRLQDNSDQIFDGGEMIDGSFSEHNET